MPSALRIDPDGTVTEVALPAEADRYRATLYELLDGPPAHVAHHRRTVMRSAEDAAVRDLPPNLTAWALVCAWDGQEIPHLLLGTVVVTAAEPEQDLEEEPADRIRLAADAVRHIMGRFQQRGAPLGESEDVMVELLRAVRAFAA